MTNEIFKDRERANEAAYFRDQDAKLLDSLRRKAPLQELAAAIGEKLEVDNPELLERVRQLGLKPETSTALFMAPLVQVAWSDGSVSRPEHDAVLRLASGRGIEAGSPAYEKLEQWLQARPSDATFDVAVEVLKYGFDVLPPAEKEERILRVVEACDEVARASGGGLGSLLGLGSKVSDGEASMLDEITKTLRSEG
jgi:tellurite resistance protein